MRKRMPWWLLSTWTCLVGVAFPAGALAQQSCQSVRDCSQKALTEIYNTDKEVSVLRERLEEEQKNIRKIEGMLAQYGTAVNNVGSEHHYDDSGGGSGYHKGDITCRAGETVVGLKIGGYGDSSYCPGCINGVYLICAKLPPIVSVKSGKTD